MTDLISTIEDGARIGMRHTGDGEDKPPPLSWSNAPVGLDSFVIICDGPDAPSLKYPAVNPWGHWVTHNIPANVSQLLKGISRPEESPGASAVRQKKKFLPFGNLGCHGSVPSRGRGVCRYFFKIFALDCQIDLRVGKPKKKSVVQALEGHVLDQAESHGIYGRSWDASN